MREEAGWGIAQPSVTESWSVVTHPAASGRPSTPAEARAFLRSLLEGMCGHLWLPAVGFADRLLRAASEAGVRGPRTFDLHSARAAHEHGAQEVWTHDRAFVTGSGLRVVDRLG